MTTYVALLRGINVGGHGKVDMKTLKGTFEELGFGDVKTYINSGNVIFTTKAKDAKRLCTRIERAITDDFHLEVGVLVRTLDQMRATTAAIPKRWTNDGAMKCDVYFLWPEIDRPSIVDELPHDPAIDHLSHVPGAVIRRVDRDKAAKSPLTKIVGTKVYKQMTARNVNTVRKLVELMEAVGT